MCRRSPGDAQVRWIRPPGAPVGTRKLCGQGPAELMYKSPDRPPWATVARKLLKALELIIHDVAILVCAVVIYRLWAAFAGIDSKPPECAFFCECFNAEAGSENVSFTANGMLLGMQGKIMVPSGGFLSSIQLEGPSPTHGFVFMSKRDDGSPLVSFP